MKFVSIESARLPEITNSIKECINLGQWLLFKADSSDKEVFYYLKTGKGIYALSQNGKILTSTPMNDDIEINELYYFSDVPKPISLSNVLAATH